MPAVYSYCGRVWACPLFSLHTLGMSGLHRSLQSEVSFYSPVRISHWADVLGIGVQCIAFVSWSLLLASSPKETLPILYFSRHFEEFYRFLSYILLPYQFEFIFLYKIPSFQWSSLLLQRHLLREFISFIDPFTLYPKPTSNIMLISLRALEEFYSPICSHCFSLSRFCYAVRFVLKSSILLSQPSCF